MVFFCVHIVNISQQSSLTLYRCYAWGSSGMNMFRKRVGKCCMKKRETVSAEGKAEFKKQFDIFLPDIFLHEKTPSGFSSWIFNFFAVLVDMEEFSCRARGCLVFNYLPSKPDSSGVWAGKVGDEGRGDCVMCAPPTLRRGATSST